MNDGNRGIRLIDVDLRIRHNDRAAMREGAGWETCGVSVTRTVILP